MDHPADGAGPPVTGDRATGRHAAFARYVLPEIDLLLRVAMTLTHQSADAEDLVQDTLIRAFRAADRFDGAHPRAWLLTILRNTHLNRIRSRRPGLLHDPDLHEQDRVSWPGSPPPASPEDLVLGGTFDHAVAQALDDLPEAFGVVIRLVDLNGLTYAEAADTLGVPIGTVMSRLHRGRSRIRQRLTQGGMAPTPPRPHAAVAKAAEHRPAERRPAEPPGAPTTAEHPAAGRRTGSGPGIARRGGRR